MASEEVTGSFSYHIDEDELPNRVDEEKLNQFRLSSSEYILRQKEQLIHQIEETLGEEPRGLRQFLSVITHPDVISYAVRYLQNLDEGHRCLSYVPPWNCAREAEAKYENLQFGWSAAGVNAGYNEYWCVNCRSRVINE